MDQKCNSEKSRFYLVTAWQDTLGQQFFPVSDLSSKKVSLLDSASTTLKSALHNKSNIGMTAVP